MSTFVDKPISLIEKKKQQWAKEREELASLCAPWSSPTQTFDRSLARNRRVSRPPMTKKNEYARKEHPTPRRSSLPPLCRAQCNTGDRDREMGGETSGYGSDNPNHNPEYAPSWHPSENESLGGGYKDDRTTRWQDKFWESKDAPNWVKRGLQSDHEIVVFNTSPAESPQHDDVYPDPPPTSHSSTMNRSYIRGQNIPMDSMELAERERKRQVALAHQEAVRQQLEEREKRRQDEREKRIREEREEELRIEREQEVERQRKEDELRQLKEKQEKERKRKEAIQEAIENAEKEARLEKIRLKTKKNHHLEGNKIEQIHNHFEKDIIIEKNNNFDQQPNSNVVIPTPTREKSAKSFNCEPTVKQINNEAHLETMNNLKNNTTINVPTPRAENVALILPPALEAIQNLQYAVLMPQYGSLNASAVPITLPITYPEPLNSARTENRILTPTQYRNRNNRRMCDSSTQTEYTDVRSDDGQRFIKEKLDNLDISYDKQRKDKKKRREHSDERPKWGVNRPPTRYMKQSEKDPLYIRRKMRQKDNRKYEYRNSSDDSRGGSPRSYRKKNYVEKRHTRALWRKNDHFFARNIRMYQTEIVPLESDKEQIYYRYKCDCCCKCKSDNKADILKIDHSPTLPDCSSSSLERPAEILDKLDLLHSGLLQKQEHWERSPRTPSLSSSTRNTENNS